MPILNLGFWIWLLPSIGGVLAIIIIWQGRWAAKPSELEDIKTDLLNMNMCQRDVALKKAQQACPEEIAMQICNDFIALFGKDIGTFTTSLIERIVSGRTIDAIVEFFKTSGDILDNNQYGLKVELEENELYRSSRMDLAQKRLKLKVRKKKGAIIQKNIDSVCSLSYGLNSSILVRSILSTNPKLKGLVPAEIRIAVEGIETATEKTLNTLLNDLDNEWKMTKKINGLLQILPIVNN